ncbi:MAG TPA: hypothetical protein VLT58_13680 [Polyangia bacterium]|nr:hypothetical protein [Polyangia bacterium]
MARTARSLLPAALLIFVAGLALRPMAESDLFFHLATGEEILRRHALVTTNLFSFTYPDAPNLDTSWLAEVGGALVFRWGGFPAVVVAKTFVLLLAFAVAYRACRRLGAGALATTVVLAAAAFVGRERFVERPHVFSLLGEAVTLSAIGALEAGGAAARRAALWFLPAVVVWSNLHAGVFAAPLMLAGAALALAATGERAGARRTALAAGASVLAMMATPVGVGCFRYLRLHLQLPVVHPVDEFRVPSWSSDAPLLLYMAALAGAAAVTLAVNPGQGRRAIVRALGPALPLALLAGHAVRFGADAALLGAPVLALAARGRWAGEEGAARRPLAALAAVVLLLGLTVGPPVAAGASSPERWGIGLDTRELPLDAIAFVNENGLRERMYNDFEIGSYLLFDPVGGYPHNRVFVDPRLPAYPLEMHRLLGRADLSREAWGAAMDRYGVESALLTYAGINRRVAWWDPAQWALVWSASDARVFVRRLPRFRELIARLEIPATFAFSADEGAATLPLEGRPAASPVSDCEWARRRGDLLVGLDGALSDRARTAYGQALAAPADCLARADESRLGAWLGSVALGEKRPGDALPLLDRALAAGNHDVGTLTSRAEALEALGRRPAAASAWRQLATQVADPSVATRARARAARLDD